MILLHDFNGLKHYVAAENVCRVTEACASSQWHGIRSVVKLYDGATIECSETADHINSLVTRELSRESD